MTNLLLANSFVWFYACLLVPVSLSLNNFNIPQSVPEVYRAFGIYTEQDGTLETPFGRWIPQGVQFSQNKIEKCPCEDTKFGPRCVPYSPEFQAATLEEALSNFKDTTVPDPQKAKSIVPSKPSASLVRTTQDDYHEVKACKGDSSCLSCTKYTLMNMLNQLESQPSNPINDKLKKEIMKNLDENGLNTPTIIPRCPELSDTKPKLDLRAGSLVNDIDQCITNATRGEKVHPSTRTSRPKYNWTAHRNHNHGTSPRPQIRTGADVPDWRRNFRGKGKETRSSRKKRQSDPVPDEIVQVFDIKCQPRGSPVSQGSTYVGLCGVCWKWGVLDTQYSPSYINLMVCDEETKCLSGWGTCNQRNRNFQVLKNTGTDANPRYESVSINVPMMCDCQVQAGSALHNFVRA